MPMPTHPLNKWLWRFVLAILSGNLSACLSVYLAFGQICWPPLNFQVSQVLVAKQPQQPLVALSMALATV